MHHLSVWFLHSTFYWWQLCQPAVKNELRRIKRNLRALLICSSLSGKTDDILWISAGPTQSLIVGKPKHHTLTLTPNINGLLTCSFLSLLYFLICGNFYQDPRGSRLASLCCLTFPCRPLTCECGAHNQQWFYFFPLIKVKTDQSYWLFTLLEQQIILCLRTGLHCYLCANCQNVN